MEAKDYIPIWTSLIGLVGTAITCGTAVLVALWINRNLKRHETVFGHLHKRRAEVIEELHKKLYALENELEVCQNIHTTGNVDNQREHLKKAQTLGDDFLSYFRQHHLFLSQEFIDRVEKNLLPEIRDYLLEIEKYIHDTKQPANEEIEHLRAISRKFISVIVPILQDLGNQIRKVIGTE